MLINRYSNAVAELAFPYNSPFTDAFTQIVDQPAAVPGLYIADGAIIIDIEMLSDYRSSVPENQLLFDSLTQYITQFLPDWKELDQLNIKFTK